MSKVEISTGAGWVAFVLLIIFIASASKIDCAIGIQAACENIEKSWIKE